MKEADLVTGMLSDIQTWTETAPVITTMQIEMETA